MPQFQRNDESSLPMPQRANDIVDEARRRLASMGGKASQLPAMIQKVTAEFRGRDDAGDQFRGTDSFNMPNNMEQYIDRVLQMGGMVDGAGPHVHASDGTRLPDAGPVPVDRPMPDDGTEQPSQEEANIIKEGEGKGWSFGQIVAGLAGVGGVAALGRYLFDRYGSGKNTPVDDAANVAKSAVDKSIDAVDGTDTPKGALVPYDQGVQGTADDASAQGAIEQEKRARLAPPPKQITDQRPVDQSPIDQTIDSIEADQPKALTDENFDARVQGDVEGRTGDGTAPSTQTRFQDGRTSDAEVSNILRKAAQMPPRDAVRFIRDSGLEMNSDLLQALAEGSNTVKSLKSRVKPMSAGEAAERAVGKTVGKSVRRALP